jgi:hypothetical protein
MSLVKRTLAAYFMNEDVVGLEKNLDLPEYTHADDEILYYRNEAGRVIGWVNDYDEAIMFKAYSADMTEAELTTIIYDITKKNFGEDGTSIRNGFRRIYQLVFKTDRGPRLPVFVALLGPLAFLDLLNMRMKNPFDLPGQLNSQTYYDFNVQ